MEIMDIKNLIDEIITEDEDARVQVYVSDLDLRYSIDSSCCGIGEVAVWPEGEMLTVAEFFSPYATEILADEIEKATK